MSGSSPRSLGFGCEGDGEMKLDQFDKLLFRGGHPDYNSLAVMKFAVVINLQPNYRGIWQEMYDAKKNHIVVHPMPLCPLLPPSKNAVLYILDVLVSLASLPPPFGKVLVHCQKGVDRTGYVIAAYRVKIQGWSVNDACAEWKAMGRSWWLGWWEWKFRKDFK